jgi:hypothetical protein
MLPAIAKPLGTAGLAYQYGTAEFALDQMLSLADCYRD